MVARDVTKRGLLIGDLEEIHSAMERRRRNNALLYKTYSGLLLVGSGLAGIGGLGVGVESTVGDTGRLFTFIPIEAASIIAGVAGTALLALRLLGKKFSWGELAAYYRLMRNEARNLLYVAKFRVEEDDEAMKPLLARFDELRTKVNQPSPVGLGMDKIKTLYERLGKNFVVDLDQESLAR